MGKVFPANSPPAGIPNPKWAVLGSPAVVPITACHSLLPHHAAQAPAAQMCRPERLVLPAKGKSSQKPALWSIVERVVVNCIVPALLDEGHLCVCVCVCFSVSGPSFTNTCSQRQVIFRNVKAYFAFRSLYICHSSQMHQLCTFSEKLYLTQDISQSWCAEGIHRLHVLHVLEQSQAEVGRWELEAESRDFFSYLHMCK